MNRNDIWFVLAFMLLGVGNVLWAEYRYEHTEWTQERTVTCDGGGVAVYAHFKKPIIFGWTEEGWGYKQKCPAHFLDEDDG